MTPRHEVNNPLVCIIAGSISVAKFAAKAEGVLIEFKIPFWSHALSAHRTHSDVAIVVRDARVLGVRVFIAVAGMAAHLGGVIAALAPAHVVIGLPTSDSAMSGLDALLSTVQMPLGKPVATVAIDGGENAGLLAAQVLATDPNLVHIQEGLLRRHKETAAKIQEINCELGKFGSFTEYIRLNPLLNPPKPKSY